MSIATMYLHNLAKRVMNGEKVYTAEVANAPKLIDKVYGNGDGHVDLDDVSEIASSIGSKILDIVDSIF